MAAHASDFQDQAFTTEQKEYLSGFFSALTQRGFRPYIGETADGLLTGDAAAGGANQAAEPAAETWFGFPCDEISKEETFKREKDPLDLWQTIMDNAEAGKFPEGGDVFRYKYHGLFYVAPAQEAFMLRVRAPANRLTSPQLRGLAEIAGKWGGNYAHVTTRGNFQIREIGPRDPAKVLMHLQEVGLISRGSGADNVRNITATPTTGCDPQELFDVTPIAKALQHYILNKKGHFNLPRKFNIAFDTGGSVSVVADTNDISFTAAAARPDGPLRDGIYFRLGLGGITGHGDFAGDTGIALKPEECVPVAAAILKVFSAHGDRTNRKRARLKYLLDDWGLPKFLDAVERELAFPLCKAMEDAFPQRHPVLRHGHIGVYRQKQRGLNYIGIALPLGRLTSKQVNKLASLAERYGEGEVRTTVWQNLILTGILDESVESVKRAIRAMGLDYRAATVSAGLVACTGNTGCRFSATNTKGHAVAIARHLDAKVTLDLPVNIHLTGCPHSCAQHYIGDIGLLGTTVADESGEKVEGYHVVLGGGSDQKQGLAREIVKAVPFSRIPSLIEFILETYLNRRDRGESFLDFTRRHSTEELQELFNDG